MDLILLIAAAFMVWMCLDCLSRKEHFIWIVIMVVLFPVGALIYFLAVKMKIGAQFLPLIGTAPAARIIETEETLQLKTLIQKFHKPYHYEKLGQLYLENKQHNEAAESFRAAVSRDPDMQEAHYGLAKALHGMGRYMEAAAVLERLTEKDKKYDYGNAIFGLAECYRLAGMEDKALQAYEAVIDSYHFLKAYYYCAKLLEKRGKMQEAINCMKDIIGASKNLPEYKLEKERHWIEEAHKFLRKNGIELA